MPKSKAKAEADARFNKKAYERIAFELRRDAEINGDTIRTHAVARGESVNGFLKRAVAQTIERDNAETTESGASEKDVLSN